HKGRGLFVADGESMLRGARWGGFFVPTNLDHIFMLFEFRRVQESTAALLAATRASPAELRAMEAAVASCRHGQAIGDHAEFDRGDDDFHLGIAAASHNSFLVASVREARTLQRQASVIGLHGVGGHAGAAVSEHEAIYRAIRDGDPEAAAHATSEHLDNTLEDYRREIQRRVFGGR
ncbi:MAG TPA: FCD domain-containing protein, partial [Streptosporangiaceae bacterium]|nr:FCD domain-containing protein [Streptosporangiaceae bacterium]